MITVTNITINKLAELNADYAGLKSYAHPQMLPFIKKKEKGIYFFNLNHTLPKLESLITKLQEIEASGKKILFVATASRIRNIIGKFIAKTDHFYVDHRWLGGTLTNFDFIQKRILLLQDLYNQEEQKITETWTKKEKFRFQAKKATLELNLKGLLKMKTLPDYLFVVNPKNQMNTLKEAQKLNIPVLALTKSDSDPRQFVEFVPINDGSIPVLELVMEEIMNLCFKKPESTTSETEADDSSKEDSFSNEDQPTMQKLNKDDDSINSSETNSLKNEES